MQLAFRVNDTRAFARAIQWWDKTPASHVELVLSTGENGYRLCVSSSMMDGGVRQKWIRTNAPDWEVYRLADEFNSMVPQWLKKNVGVKYDYMGLLAQVFRPMRDNPKKLWCGEAVASALGLEQPWRYTPGVLYALARSIGVRVS